jgi:hypothetical protein
LSESRRFGINLRQTGAQLSSIRFVFAMNIGETLISEATNLLLLIPTVIGLVILTRWFQGQPAFTDCDWRFLFGQPREKVFSLKLWVKFAALWFAVVVVGFAISFYVLPYGLI